MSDYIDLNLNDELTVWDEYDYKDGDKLIQNGLKIVNLNVHGITHNHKQRLDLYNWIVKEDIDIITIQEWYVHHKYESKVFDMSLFYGYKAVQCKSNTKTLIIYKDYLQIQKFDKLQCEEDGLDTTWMAVFNKDYILPICSVYNRPFDKIKNEIDYNILDIHMATIKKEFKNRKEKLIFILNGDFNAKHLAWLID